MEITVSQAKLKTALNNVSRIAGGRVTLPVLNNVLIKVEASKVSLITTNLDMAEINYLPVSDSKDGVITVPAKLLAEYISNLPREEQITLSSNEDNKISVKAGRYSSVMNATSAEDFPELPEINEEKAVTFRMGVDEFRAGLENVIVAISRDSVRPALTGVYFTSENDNFIVVTTDGYRFCEKIMIKNIKSEFSAIVPANTINEVLHSINDGMEEIEITLDEDLVRFRLGEVEIVSKLLEGPYPDYHVMIPAESPIKAVVGRSELLRVAKLSSIFAARATTGAIICELKEPDTFGVRSITSEVGENDAEIAAEVTANAKMTISARYLVTALGTIDTDKVRIEFSENGRSMVLRNQDNDDYLHVIMSINI